MRGRSGRIRLNILLLGLLIAGLVAGGGLFLWRWASPPGPDPVLQAMSEIVTAYRKMIILLHDEARLPQQERPKASSVGYLIFQQNQERLGALRDRIAGEAAPRLQAATPSAPSSLERFLDHLERHPDYHDADKLAFRDLLQDLAAFLTESAPGGPLKATLERIAADATALRDIQQIYERELAQIFSRLRPRGMAVRREAWETYVALLRTRHSAEEILKEYEGAVEAWSDTRGPQGDRPDGPREVSGVRFPPRTLLLTFDDGPHARHTGRVVEILKKFNVPAVFFEVGKNVGAVQGQDGVKLSRAAAATRLVLEAGMFVANHSYSHPVLSKLSGDQLTQELEWTERVLAQVSAAGSGLFRAPYGARNDQVMAALKARNLTSVMWNVDSKDWADPIPRSIADRVLEQVDAEGRGILLFHDIHERTVEALPLILESLRAEGYRFAAWDGGGFAVRGTPVSEQATPAQAKPKPAPYRESWAVVVGIDEYGKWSKLRYAVNDATAVKEILVRKYHFKPQNVFTLINQEATRQNILSLLGDKLANPDLVQRDDRVFIFFAGHGTTRRLPSGRDLGYIIPVEGDPTNYHGQSISMTNFQDIAEAIPAKHILFVMDSCYSGLALTRGGRPVASQNYLAEISRRSARQMLTAGGADQQVADNGPNGHSVFTWTLLQALEGKGDLNGDGYITAAELAAYVGPVVSSLSRQTPAFGSMPGSEGGEFVFELGHETEFLSGLSGQLEDEAIRLNTEIDKLRAEVAAKTARNQRLKQELAQAQSTLQTLETSKPIPPSAKTADSMWTHNDRGSTLFKARQYGEALQAFLEAARVAPSHPLAANNVGYTYFRMERYSEAVQWFEKAIALDPRRAIAYLNLGDAYFKLDKKPEAKQAFTKYLELAPASKSAPYAQDMLKSLE